MGLYDDLLEEQPNVAPQKNVKNYTKVQDCMMIC